jgi:Lrp/AsnC family leucine-responsive transcriptional regulator
MAINDLDPTGREILKLMQNETLLANKEISFKLRKSIAVVHERLRRLKEQGYIQHIVAILVRKKGNRGLTAFSQVLLNDHTTTTIDVKLGAK